MRVISYWKATRVIKHHGFHHQYADTVTSMAQSTLEISVHKRNQWSIKSYQHLSQKKWNLYLRLALVYDTLPFGSLPYTCRLFTAELIFHLISTYMQI